MKTARATIVEFTPSSGVRGHARTRLAYDVSERDGGGRFMVTEKDAPRARELLWCGVNIRFDPQDQFAMLDEECANPLCSSRTRCTSCQMRTVTS